jgi:teichuronic acid biosynthesis glycosyltransferase TuaG
MPCHNGGRTIEQAVRSVMAQTFIAWELIIVDDGSTDDSPDRIAALAAGDHRIRIIRNDKPSGAGAARNAALRSTRARYVAFLDCDDAWLPEKLSIQLQAMEDAGAALACGPYDVMDGAGTITGHVAPPPGPLSYRAMLANDLVGCLTAVLDRSQCGDVRFNTELPKSEDYQLWLSILKRGLRGICVPETLGIYRVHGNTLSSNKFSAARNRWRVYREFQKHNLITSAFFFSIYAVTGVLKMMSMQRNRVLGPFQSARMPRK